MLHAAAFDRNQQFMRPGVSNFTTALSPQDETAFESWVQKNGVPFQPSAPGPQDYDMRGFWQGLMAGDPHAQTGIDPNDHKLHYTDYWKTPYHESFSRESKFATPAAPDWRGDRLVGADGTVYFDDTNSDASREKLISGYEQNLAQRRNRGK